MNHPTLLMSMTSAAKLTFLIALDSMMLTVTLMVPAIS